MNILKTILFLILISLNSFAGLTTTSRVVRFTGNGATSVYAYDYRVDVNSELEVVVRYTDDTETILTLTTDYTVSGVGDGTGGNVTLVDANQVWLDSDGDLLSNYVITIRGNRPLTQQSDFRNAGTYFPETHEEQFDKILMSLQTMQEEVDRCVKTPVSYASATGASILADVVTRASTRLAFDASGLLSYVTTDVTGVAASAFGATLVDDTTAAAARTTLAIAQSTDILAHRPGTYFLGINFSTTTDTDDTINVTQSDGTALSSSNPGYVIMPGATDTGQLKVFTLTANISVLVTAAHWGMGGNGNQTEIFQFLYWINDDDSTLKLGIIPNPNLIQIADTSTSTTQASVNLATEMLVDSAIDSGTWPVMRWGWGRSNFNDTGDIWAGQNDADDIHVGTYVPRVEIKAQSSDGDTYASNNTKEAFDFEDIVQDLMGRITGENTGVAGTWRFTPNMTVTWKIKANVLYQGNSGIAAGEACAMAVFVDNSEDSQIYAHEYEGTGTFESGMGGATEIPLNAGADVEIRISNNTSTSVAMSTGAGDNNISISN